MSMKTIYHVRRHGSDESAVVEADRHEIERPEDGLKALVLFRGDVEVGRFPSPHQLDYWTQEVNTGR